MSLTVVPPPGKQTVPFAPFVHFVQSCNEITFARWQLVRGFLPLVSRLGRNIVKAKGCPGQDDTLAFVLGQGDDLALVLGQGDDLALGLGQGDTLALGHSHGLSHVQKMFV